MSATIRQIVDDAQGIVGEVAGAGVQTYGEDRMFGDAIRGFNMLFKKRFWDQYQQWHQLTLDGTLGIVTTDDLETVRDFEDIQVVHRDGDEVPLPRMPRKKNPFGRISTASGDAQFWTALNVGDANYETRKLQIYPKASTGLINVCARHYPLPSIAEEWNWEDIMYLDRDLLAYASAFMTLMGDALNNDAANIVKELMEEKYRLVTGALSNHKLSLSGDGRIPTRYTEYP